MGSFDRTRSGGIVLHLTEVEADVLPSMVHQLSDLVATREDHLADVRGEGTDPFAVWEASFSKTATVEDDAEDSDDPILRRLFPDAYVDDPEASYDFRRFTIAEQRREKVADCATVLEDLRLLSVSGRVGIADDRVDAWMRTLNNLRLVLAVTMGISDEISASEAAEAPADDPRAMVHDYYSWLGWMLESLMECVLVE